MSRSRAKRSSAPNRSRRTAGAATTARVFAALGDETRLAVVTKLSGGARKSISQLASGMQMTRQAVTKHLRVLEDVGVVTCIREGRESLFKLDPAPVMEMQVFLRKVSEQWDQALGRLKAFVEDDR